MLANLEENVPIIVVLQEEKLEPWPEHNVHI
jgi:hypothetical protein